jgi:hypothetical protein
VSFELILIMPALEVSTPPENHEPETPTAQPIVGIIYPPPEVRSILTIHTPAAI